MKLKALTLAASLIAGAASADDAGINVVHVNQESSGRPDRVALFTTDQSCDAFMLEVIENFGVTHVNISKSPVDGSHYWQFEDSVESSGMQFTYTWTYTCKEM